MKRYLFIVVLCTVLFRLLHAQELIRGRVYGLENQPIYGATIKSESGEVLGVSDSLGIFTLKATSLETIVISHISFTDYTVKLANREDPLVIVMESGGKSIEEVNIYTGIQQIPKERATGAFALVDNATFNEQVSSDVISRLEAVANGLNVDHLAQDNELGIRIRGLSTFSSGAMKNPLIILDDFPFEGDLGNINPNDVESVTLLKDAAASSIWGARAANGVIVITTKQGKPHQPLQIDFNSNITVAGKPNLMGHDLMSPRNFIEVEQFLFDNNFRFGDTASYSKPSFSPVYEVLFRQRAGKLTQSEANRLIDEMSDADIRQEYLNHLYEPSVTEQYALNIAGGSDNTAWYFSTGYDRAKTDLSAKSERLTVNFRNTYRPISNLRVQTGLMHVQGKSISGRTGFSNGNMPPYTRFVDEVGNPLPATSKLLSTYRYPLVDTLGSGLLLDWKYYPLTNDDYETNRSSRSHTLLNAQLHYKAIDWLDLDIKYQYGRQQTKGSFLWEEESYFARNIINQFTYFDPSGNAGYNVPKGGVLDASTETVQSHNLRGQLTVRQNWDRHALHMLVGVEAADKSINNNIHRTYGYNPNILTFSQVDYLRMYPLLVEQYEWFIPQNQQFNEQANRFISTFANGSYTYLQKYTLNVSGRWDASNLFGVNTNDRWNLLWSAGIGWEASKEAFYRVSFLPYLRFRATYGFSGNTDLTRSAVTTIRYGGTSSYTLEPYASISQHANPELRWEKVKTTNLAADFRSKNNRLSGSFDFFLKHATDLLAPDPIGYTTGISGTVIRNVAELKGRGFDLQVSSANIERPVFRWHSVLNLSYYDDKVVQYYRPSLSPSNYIQTSHVSANIEGERMYPLYTYRWAGLDEMGNPMAYLNGVPSKDYSALRGTETKMSDLVNHGSSIPLFFGTVGNTLTYKNIGLSFRLMFKFDYSIRTAAVRYYFLFHNGGLTDSEWGSRWKVPGDEMFTDVPSMVYPANSARDNVYRYSDIKAHRGDHVRLQYVNLYYDMRARSQNESRINSIRFYFNITNMGILWKRGKYSHDPMYGFDNIPPSTAYSLGLRFSIQ